MSGTKTPIVLGYFWNKVCLASLPARYPERGSLTDKDTDF